MFGAWCACDYLLVRFAPSRMHAFDALGLLLPIAVGVAGAGYLRHLPPVSRVNLSIAAALLATIVAVVLIVWLGIPFHFRIGGQL